MGTVRSPDPALVVVSAIYSNETDLTSACSHLSAVIGELSVFGGDQVFDWTDYYQAEMGSALKRRFMVARDLLPRQLLTELKLLSNAIEREYARPDGSRTINLDPGLLAAENFVLATTKNFSHRIYLREGIFAEVTLQFVRGAFEPLAWTYPDYRSETLRSLLGEQRRKYLTDLRGNHTIVAENAFNKELLL
jgi:hypothetical protein